jgi:hypothetical protein
MWSGLLARSLTIVRVAAAALWAPGRKRTWIAQLCPAWRVTPVHVSLVLTNSSVSPLIDDADTWTAHLRAVSTTA